jgi:hypothetical protein
MKKNQRRYRYKQTYDNYDNNTQIKLYFGDFEKITLYNKYKNNSISTSKYNVFTFLPKSIFFQFTRAANIYFLIISVLTCCDFSPKSPVSMISTFAMVLFFTLLKEAVEVKYN